PHRAPPRIIGLTVTVCLAATMLAGASPLSALPEATASVPGRDSAVEGAVGRVAENGPEMAQAGARMRCQPPAGVAANKPLGVGVKTALPRNEVRYVGGSATDKYDHPSPHGGFESSGMPLGMLRSTIAYGSVPRDKRHCFWVTGISFVMNYSGGSVHLAPRHKPGSCHYNAYLEHQKKHLEAARRVFEQYMPRLKGAVSAGTFPLARSPILVDSLQDAQAEMRRLADRLADPIHKQIGDTLNKAEDQIDTEAEYKRVRGACSGW
ncbi:MAG: hypothetical protein ACREGL_12355, partial [Alphaproteobacteria bacterium]